MLSRLSIKTIAWLRIAPKHWQPLARPVKIARYSSCLAERRRASSIGPLESRQSCVPSLYAQTASAGALSGDSLVLGIESSCDDTGVAVVRASDGAILGQAVTGQVDIHAPWGGVVPKLAQEAHERAMESTVQAALQEACISQDQLEGIAVTIGPGLSLCLQVGVQKARRIAAQHGLKYIPVHHMEAHALIARAGTAVQFPYLCLLVSGGHNMIVIVEGVGSYTLLGSTLDDAVGEAYDKVARLLGLDLNPSGGAAVEALAREGDDQRFKFSPPLRQKPNCNFSYAGLKTAVRLAIEAEVPDPPSEANRQVRADIAASFQRVALDHLENRVSRAAAWALEEWPGVKHLVVAGGVAANRLLRSKLRVVAKRQGLELAVPPAELCTDNGVMVAWAGIERMRLGLWEHLPVHSASADEAEWVDVRPRWPLTDRRDNRSMSEPRSERKKRLHTSLTELTQEALQLLESGSEGQQNGAAAQISGALPDQKMRMTQQASAA